MKHIEFEKLVNNFEGLLPVSEAREIAEHLNRCAQCAAEAEILRDFFAYAAVDKKEAVPQATTARLLNIFTPPKTAPAKNESFTKKLLATLFFDDWKTAFNERFSGGDTRQLLYRADDVEIDLRLNFSGGKCQLSGQVFAECSESAAVEIFSETAAGEKIPLNDYCEFSLSPLPEGVYQLRFLLGEKIIEINDLSLEQ